MNKPVFQRHPRSWLDVLPWHDPKADEQGACIDPNSRKAIKRGSSLADDGSGAAGIAHQPTAFRDHRYVGRFFLPSRGPKPDVTHLGGVGNGSRRIRWTIVLAFYNEVDEIAGTLRQILRQTTPFKLILVDNGSTDCSVARCHCVLAGRGIDYMVLTEESPGQVAAIETGLAHVDTEFVATCDADTFYPESYLRTAEAAFDADRVGTVAISAYFIDRSRGPMRNTVAAIHQLAAAAALARQTHVGGAGHSFRTSALRAAGGYSRERWPYLLADHEVMHRVMKYGRQRLGTYHWCSPSTRRGEPVRWSLLERIGYHITPFAYKDRYFRWLARRFQKRGMQSGLLRVRDWDQSAA